MASNSFGRLFRLNSFGESHGPAIGGIIDGCPAGIALTVDEINQALFFRRPGQSAYTTPRAEADLAEILSGVFEGKTTGAPIAILIRNQDADSSQYETIKNLYRPGHANFTYLEKYGIFDYRGGGRSSARETAVRVAAGVVARKLLEKYQIDCVAYVAEIGGIEARQPDFSDLSLLRSQTYSSPIFCPDELASNRIKEQIERVKKENDSVGGIIACVANVPVGLGDPVYSKLEANLAAAMLSIPASKGFEIGCGFQAARMRGSEHNDAFEKGENGLPRTATNHSGGTLGGISTGAPLYFRVAFKPTSSTKRPQQTVSVEGESEVFQLPETARHDPCVAIRAVPVVEAMCFLVLADALLMNRSSTF